MRYAASTSPARYSVRGQSIAGSAIDASLTVLAGVRHEVISLAMGSPAPDAIPVADLAEITARTLVSDRASAALDYTPTEGSPVLRGALLDYLSRTTAEVAPECLLVTAGGMQGLDLTCKLFVEPGDLVLAESPSYANGLATILNYGADLIQVPLLGGGLDLEAARAVISDHGRPPKLIYVIPTFQNPSGITYSIDSRIALLEFAREVGALILEDDPYGELRYDGDAPPSLLELDGATGRVVQVRTFSKIVTPGLRVGWVVAASDVISRMIAAKQSVDTCTNSLAQYILADFIGTGRLDDHIRFLRQLYPRRRDAMVEALRATFPAGTGVSWNTPAGGMFIWLSLPPAVDSEQLLERALAAGVAMVPGPAFDPRLRNALRLCFTACDERLIAEGVRRLGAALVRQSEGQAVPG